MTHSVAQYPPFLENPARARCRYADPDLFFQDGERRGAATRKLEAARAYCYPCPLRRACLQWALDTGQLGVYGGTSEEERAELRRRRARA